MLAHVLLEMLVDPPPGAARRRVWRVVAATALMLLGLAALVGAVWLLVQTAHYGWQTADWERMSAADNLPMYSVLLIVYPLAFLMAWQPVPQRVQRGLLDTIAADDARVVTWANPQPEPLAADDLTPLGAEPYDLAPLRAFAGGYYGSSSFYSLLLPVTLIIMQSGSVLTELTQAFGVQQPWHLFGLSLFDPSLLLLLTGFGAFFAALFLSTDVPLLRRLRVTADERGLTRQRGRWATEQSTAWSGVRAFWRAAYSPQFASVPVVTYLVDTRSGVFGWMLTARSKDAEQQASALLIRLIVTRADVELRDLAPLMSDLARTKNTLRQLRSAPLPDAIKAPLITLRRRLRQVLWLILPALALFAALVAGPEIADSRLQAAQKGYFTGLAPHILAQTPLYHDALAADNGQWPVTAPSAANHQARQVFSGGAYTTSGQSGQPVMALGPRQFGDAAIAVTVSEQGTAGQGSATQDGVGLVLRARADGHNLQAFYVSADGTWTVEQYRYDPRNPGESWNYVDSGESSAIQRGDNATNRLLVLARGPVYLFYVNGVLVDPTYIGFYNRPQDAPASGYAGVFLNDGADTGSFTDFTVYPVQSPPSLSYV